MRRQENLPCNSPPSTGREDGLTPVSLKNPHPNKPLLGVPCLTTHPQPPTTIGSRGPHVEIASRIPYPKHSHPACLHRRISARTKPVHTNDPRRTTSLRHRPCRRSRSHHRNLR